MAQSSAEKRAYARGYNAAVRRRSGYAWKALAAADAWRAKAAGATVFGTCAGCRFWGREPGCFWGRCRNNAMSANGLLSSAWGNDGAGITTQENFGCVNFEPAAGNAAQ